MNRYLGHLRNVPLLGLLALCGCGPEGGEPMDMKKDGGDTQSSFVRVHYRVQDGAVSAWGVHFFGAGSTSPKWGAPQLFKDKDEFGGYTDVKVSATEDKPDAWLGLIPVSCTNGDCKKDVETSVRFVDLEKAQATPNIGECWITQGQAIQVRRPAATGPAYKISRAREFIDLGNGSVRLMFRVAPGSTGTVSYGAEAGTLSSKVSWSIRDDVNKSGLLLPGLTPGTKTYYKISSVLAGKDAKEWKDESPVLDLVPVQFATVTDAADWATWGSKGIMYQLIVRTFADGGSPKAVSDGGKESGIDPAKRDGIGDLVGLKSTLPYLRDLGADAIWMTPVFKSKSYHGYDTTDFFDIDPAAGTRKDFADLVDAAHKLGIRIILDLVENHVADVNPWFLKAMDPKDPEHAKYREWFVWSDEYTNMITDKHPFDPSAVIWACKSYACYHQIFGASIPELNFRNPEVRAEMKRIAAYWIELGADGFRLDASKHIDQFDDNNGTAMELHGTHVWWKEFNYHVKKGVARPMGTPPVILAGENRWDDPKIYGNMVPYAGDMDSQFDFPFRSLLANFVTGKGGDDVDFVKYIRAVKKDAADKGLGGNPNHYFERFLSNHDLDRPATQFAGTGALGPLLRQAATIVLTVPGMPVIYYGEEVGKQGKRDKFLGTELYSHDEFIREPMSWYKTVSLAGDKKAAWDIDFAKTNSDNAGLMLGARICKAANPDYPFIKFMGPDDPNSWAAQKDEVGSLFRYYKQLIALRRANSAFTDLAAQLSTVTNDAEVYEFKLENADQTLSVLLSRKATEQTVTRAATAEDLLTGAKGKSFTVPPYGALILK